MALVEEIDHVAQLLDDVEIMLDDTNGLAAVGQLAHDRKNFRKGYAIQSGQGLVEQEYLGSRGQQPADHQEFLLSIGQVLRRLIGLAGEADEIQHGAGADQIVTLLAVDSHRPKEYVADPVAGLVGLERWTFSWQSAGRTPEPWLGPDIKQVLGDQAREGAHAFLVCPIGFVADHMETLYDLDIDCRAHAERLGVRFERTAGLNASPDFIAVLADLVRGRVREAAFA